MSDVRCAACGEPGHRYGRNEGMDRFDPQACINGLRGRIEELREDALAALRSEGWEVYRPEDDAEPAWLGETNVDEIQDVVYDRHAHVIDVSKMDPVWILNRLVPVPAESEEGL